MYPARIIPTIIYADNLKKKKQDLGLIFGCITYETCSHKMSDKSPGN